MRKLGDTPRGPVFLDENTGSQFLWNGMGWEQYVAVQTAPPPPPPVLYEPPPPPPGSSAVMRQADTTDLARNGWYRRAFYPTAPIYFEGAGKVTRLYGATMLPTDPDYIVNSAGSRTVRVDNPCILVSINAAAFSTAAGNALPVGVGPRDCFLVELTYGAQNDKITTGPRLASTVAGTGERPGELGGDGWVVNAGSFVLVTITPLLPSLRVDVTLVMLEQRGRANFVPPPI